MEDCSCYMKQCSPNEILTPDYECTNVNRLNGNFYCPDIHGLGSGVVKKKKRYKSDTATKNFQNKDISRLDGIAIPSFVIGIGIGLCIFGAISSCNKNRKHDSSNLYVPEILIRCNRLSVVYGTKTELMCEWKSNIEYSHVYWTKRSNNGTTKVTTAIPDIEGCTVLYPSLILCSPMTEDSGEYVCCFEYKSGTACSPPIKLSVFGDVPKCEPEDTCYYAVIGEIIRISCNVTANPPCTKVVWKKLVDKQYITIKTEVKKSLHRENTSITSTLSFDDISEQESGEYFCFATNDFGTSKSKLISLNCEDTDCTEISTFGDEPITIFPFPVLKPRRRSSKTI